MIRSERLPKVRFHRPAELPGVEILSVQGLQELTGWFHQAYAVAQIFQSTGEILYRRRAATLPPGALAFHEPGEFHRTTRLSGPAAFKVLFLSPELLEQSSSELGAVGKPHLKLLDTRDPSVFGPFTRFHALLERDSPALETETALAQCVHLLLEKAGESPPPVFRGSNERPAVRKAKALLEERFAENLTLEDLSREVGISRFHLLRAFTREVGITPHAFQVQIRLGRALCLLKKKMAPALVAADLGFSDQSHFSRHFKRWIRITPGEYARSSRGTFGRVPQ